MHVTGKQQHVQNVRLELGHNKKWKQFEGERSKNEKVNT